MQLALPVVLAELGWMLQGVVDVIMVGRLGPVAIGAVALGNAAYYAPSLFALGLLLGMDTVVSHAFGRKDYDACHRWLAQGVYIAVAVTVPMMLLLAGISLLFPHLGVAAVMVAPATSYLRVLLWGTLPLLLYVAARRYLQSVGQVRVITLTFAGANLMNWGGNWVLINGKLGFPAMGVAGSALSTVLSRIMMAATLFGFAWNYERRRGHPLFAHWARPVGREIRELLRLGLPTAFQLLMEVGAFALATVIAGTISPVALAAHQIALNSAALAYMVPLGISAAAAISVGHAVGAGDPERARRAGWLSIGLGVAFMVVVAVVFLVMPRPLIAMYTHDPAVMAVGIPLFALASAFAVFDGVQIVATGALRGLGQTRVPMLANLVGYWVVGIPMGMALCYWAHWGVFGIWTGLTTALILISIVLFISWRRRSLAIVIA
jgi:multidrug resistance protein, MATE family